MSPTLRALVQGMVDYAGLFPPADLDMREAVANYATYHASDDAWALGRFVVSSTRLAEFEGATGDPFPNGDRSRPWRVSLLVARPVECTAIEAFNRRWAGRMVIDAVEGKAASPSDIEALAAAAPPGIALFVELAVDDVLASCLLAVRGAGASAKLRTGGVTASAFPGAADVVRFIRECTRAGVAFKATAGLHHPVRGTYRLTYAPNSATGPMYGYLNVLLAAAVIRGGGSDADASRVLLADSVDDLTLTDRVASWGGVEIPSAAVASVRDGVRGIGSCSFREPLDELTALAVART